MASVLHGSRSAFLVTSGRSHGGFACARCHANHSRAAPRPCKETRNAFPLWLVVPRVPGLANPR